MLRSVPRWWRRKRRDRRKLALAVLFTLPALLPLFAISVWALLEPRPPETDSGKIHCEYTEKKNTHSGDTSIPTILCEQTHTNAQEYEAYRAIKNFDVNALAPAFRHWIAGVLGDPVSLFTAVLAFSTIGLWQYTAAMARGADRQVAWLGRQTEILFQQKDLARLQYYAEHRPRLIVRDVFFDGDGHLVFEIHNVGERPAKIIDGWASLGNVDDERWFKRREGITIYELAGISFEIGELKELSIIDTPAIAVQLLTDENPSDTIHRYNLFFFGRFNYVDDRGEEFGAKRLAVFRREWNVPRMDFFGTGNSDHEYSD